MKNVIFASLVAAACYASDHAFGNQYLSASGYGGPPTSFTPRVPHGPPRSYRPRSRPLPKGYRFHSRAKKRIIPKPRTMPAPKASPPKD